MIPTNIYNELKKYEAAGNYTPSIKPRVYIAGPMRGYENLNFNAFFEAEERLKKKGYIVINPARNPLGLIPEEYMQIDLAWVSICDYIYMLEGWEESAGATTEHQVAKSVGKIILYERDDYEYNVMDRVDEDDFRGSVDAYLDGNYVKGDVTVCFTEVYEVDEDAWSSLDNKIDFLNELIEKGIIVEPDPILIKEIEELIEGVKVEEEPLSGTVFYIFNCYDDDGYDYWEEIEEKESYLNSLGFDDFETMSYDPFLDKQRIERMDYFFRFKGWEEDSYNFFLNTYAKQIGKTIIDE